MNAGRRLRSSDWGKPGRATYDAAKAHADALHPGREGAVGDGVEQDALGREVRGHKEGEAMQRGLGRTAEEGIEHRGLDAVDRADVDDARGRVGGCRCAQQEQQ